ncbi:MAG: hypothetical protein EA349_15390 [Halomonadaceae bacterium]|nr:MAG: hypothetical protein EA349_15390 [Halomonadaceae bacterium]
MTPTAIIITLFALAVLGIGMLVISQAREKARIEHMRRIQALENRHSMLWRFLTELPEDYLEQPIKRLILDRALAVSRELKSLSGPGKWDKQIAANEQALQALAAEEQPQPSSPPSADQAKAIRQLLQLLFRFVEKQQRNGSLSSDIPRHTLQHIHYLAARCQAEVLVNQAQHMAQGKHYRRAIHAYHLALSQLDKCREHQAAAESISQYRLAIKQLTERAEAQEHPERAPTAEQNDEMPDAVHRQWDDFIHEEEAWKKKADYDK